MRPTAGRFPPFPPRRRSRGCLGCLTQCLLGLAVGGALILLSTWIFAPWGFYLGGNFHILPMWQGWGTLRADSGRYVLYVRFQPRPSGRGSIYPGPSVGGNAWLCSPRGEIFYMHLGGGMRRGIGNNTDGEKISLYMDNYKLFFGNMRDHRPYVEFRGQWQNPNLVMDDHGSISRAFNADGTVDDGKARRNRPYPGPIVPITLVPGSYSDFEAACKAK